MELLHVSAYKPHELTQQFVTGTTQASVPFTHMAPWFNPTATNQPPNLYRAFEFLETHSRATGVPLADGRIPGLINLNTIWDLETFRAICDTQTVNGFYTTTGSNPNAQVDAMFNQLVALRNPNNALSATFNPFKCLRDQLPQNPPNGIEDTFLRLGCPIQH